MLNSRSRFPGLILTALTLFLFLGLQAMAAPPTYRDNLPILSTEQNRVIFVNVTSPLPGQQVGDDFVVTGKTDGNVQVLVWVWTQTPTTNGKRLVSASGLSDAKGLFSIPVHLGTSKPGNDVRLMVSAADPMNPAATSSEEVEFNIATGGE